jgi:hypothetical protein
MNERIEQLAKQVGAVRNVMAMGRNDGVLFTEFELEKFAELIVRECQDNLAWHGHDEAVSQLDWFKVNRFGLK